MSVIIWKTERNRNNGFIRKNEIVTFENGELRLDVTITPDKDTVWLTLDQMGELFQRDRSVIGKHIRNIYKEKELDEMTSGQILPQSQGITNRPPKVYNLDVIISVGYRVKSPNGILFRKWANNILREYLLKGYVVNDRHYQDIEYITKVLDEYKNTGGQLPGSDSMLEFLKAYQRGFKILDDYDHHSLKFPLGEKDLYVIKYHECIEFIHETMFSDKADLFAIEKDNSFQSSIATIYQSFGEQELYPTIEDKASALLYFIVKNHSFIDGNKRIGATIFLYFLEKNNALYKNGKERIHNDALATLTILVASSRPEDKDIILELIKTILN